MNKKLLPLLILFVVIILGIGVYFRFKPQPPNMPQEIPLQGTNEAIIRESMPVGDGPGTIEETKQMTCAVCDTLDAATQAQCKKELDCE